MAAAAAEAGPAPAQPQAQAQTQPASGQQGAAEQEWACPCLNVRLRLLSDSSSPPLPSQQPQPQPQPQQPWHATLASYSAIQVAFPFLTARETLTLPGFASPLACTRCINCATIPYAALKPAPPGPARSYGFNPANESPSRDRDRDRDRDPARPDGSRPASKDARPYEPFVRPLDSSVVILPNILSPQQVSQAQNSPAFSPAFRILVKRRSELGFYDDDQSKSQPQSLPASSSATTVTAADTTPNRPTSGTRRPSLSHVPSNVTYTLPAVPAHLLTSPPQSPKPPSTATMGSISTQLPSSSLLSTGFAHPLASTLDATAVERLREFRSKAEAEVFELVRQKRREMEALEKRIREEAETLLEITRTRSRAATSSSVQPATGLVSSLASGAAPTNSSGASALQGQLNGAEPGRHRGLTIAAAEGASSRRDADVRGRPSTPATTGTAIGTGPVVAVTSASSSQSPEQHLDYHEPQDMDLPASAFERRPTGSVAPSRPTVSSSLSALSASFAMRGRDPPTQLEDWASKRRLRERYPEGDHSALPSAVNSDDENNTEDGHGSTRPPRSREISNNTEDEAELDRRGRGRAPQRLEGFPSQQAAGATTRPATVQEEDKQPQQAQAEAPRGRGRESRGEGTIRGAATAGAGTSQPSLPPMLSSSVLTKRPAVVGVDDGRNTDADTPKVGGKLLSPRSAPEPSADVTLRPRNPPPANAEPLKPATKRVDADDSSALSSAVASSAQRSAIARKASEKKVAFAEAEDTVENHTVLGDDEDEDEEQGESSAVAALKRQPQEDLVDETDAAVFEIDEDGSEDGATHAQDDDDDNDPDGIEGGGGSGSSERLDQPLRQARGGIRHGASGRIRGQGDDSFPGLDDEHDHDDGMEQARRGHPGHVNDGLGHHRQDTEDDDDLRSSDDDVAGIGAASFSAMAASQSAMNELATSFARADDSGFDPASLRLDGRVVPEPSLGVNGGDPEKFMAGYRGSAPFKSDVRAEGVSGSPIPRGSPVAGPGRRSGSRSRALKKEDADTEVRLSGLLAPNAPSHRSLWSPQDNKARKAGKYKYQLDEEDDQKWAAWQKKVKDAESRSLENSQGGVLARSMPRDVGPPERFMGPHSGIGARYSSRAGGGLAPPAVAPLDLSASGARAIPTGQQMYGTSVSDLNSGFEREPKTSLPYKERMMVPSLRKAIRRSMLLEEAKPTLETIPDAREAELSPTLTVGKPVPVKAATTATTSVRAPQQQQTLAGSQVTRGFVVPPQAAAASAPPAPAVGAVAGLLMKEAAVGTSASGTSTPNSMGRRSPRPPYVPPPPPRSYNTVLESDPANAPKTLDVFQVGADTSFSLYEQGEEEETDEGWEKVLLFLHRLQRLKLNKRTGWLHHRVSQPESIADHMYRMGMLAMLCPREADVDIGKCVMLALVHDLAEAEVGDLTPLDGVGKEEKARREYEAMQYFAHDLLGSSAAGLRLEALWNEYEERETKEAKLVKDLDRFELCLQAVEYERSDKINDLQGFFEGSLPHIGHPRIRRWARSLIAERQRLWAERGVVFEQPVRDEPGAELR